MKFNSAIAPDDGKQRWPPELKKYVKFIQNTKIFVFLRHKEISYAEISVYQVLVYSLTDTCLNNPLSNKGVCPMVIHASCLRYMYTLWKLAIWR